MARSSYASGDTRPRRATPDATTKASIKGGGVGFTIGFEVILQCVWQLDSGEEIRETLRQAQGDERGSGSSLALAGCRVSRSDG